MKRISYFIVLILSLIFTVDVNASLSSTMDSYIDKTTPRPSSVRQTFGVKSRDAQGGFYIKSQDGVYIEPRYKRTWTEQGSEVLYCIASNDLTVGNNDIYAYYGEITDPGYIYIAKNGYPNKSYGAIHYTDEDDSYSITQLAIWLYNHEVMGDEYDKYDIKTNYKTSSSWNATMMGHVLELLNGAKNAHNTQMANGKRILPSMGTPSITSTGLVLNNGSLVSEEVTVPLTLINTYTVSANNGAKVIDANGNEKTTFNAGEKFRVKLDTVDVNASVTVTITSSGIIERVYAYNNTTNTKAQHLLNNVIHSETVNFSQSLQFNYSDPKKAVTISKQDITNSQELAGATLELYDEKGTLILQWVSTNEPKVLSLAPGKYSLKETIAPTGYIKSEETIEFVVSETGATSAIVMKNQPIKSVAISKQDAVTEKELEGATLELYKEDGTLVLQWISTKEPKILTLDPGKYSLKEIIAPDGYVQTTETVEFTVNADGTTSPSTIIMKNQPIIEVPKTALNTPQVMFLASVIIGAFGIALIYTAKKEMA